MPNEAALAGAETEESASQGEEEADEEETVESESSMMTEGVSENTNERADAVDDDGRERLEMEMEVGTLRDSGYFSSFSSVTGLAALRSSSSSSSSRARDCTRLASTTDRRRPRSRMAVVLAFIVDSM